MNKENIATTSEGITVNKEKTEIYFGFEPLFYFSFRIIKSIKIFENKAKNIKSKKYRL